MRTKLTVSKISEVLDEATKGLNFRNIAKNAEVAQSTAFNIIKEFPLWDYFRFVNLPEKEKKRERRREARRGR